MMANSGDTNPLNPSDQDVEETEAKAKAKCYSRIRKIIETEIENFKSDPLGEYTHWWRKMFLASCMVAVSIDPLFLYIPIIKRDNECFGMDTGLKNVALILRTLTDFAYLWHIIVQITNALYDHYTERPDNVENPASQRPPPLKLPWSRLVPWTPLFIDILAILPIPQLVVLVFYSKMGGSRTLTTRKFLYSFLLFQYAPRIVRIFLSAQDLSKGLNSFTRSVRIRAVFNFFLYIIAAHVLGAFWYFHSIFRVTECWHLACKHRRGCIPNAFSCGGNSPIKDDKFLKDFCPINPPNATVYNFGIFADAIESGIIGTTDFPKKFFNCFWWGLRNLSSFGTNLSTNGNVWEICFVILISIFGLLLFLYLIGNVQTYMQLGTTKSEEIFQKLQMKEPEVELFASTHGGKNKRSLKRVIMRFARRVIKEKNDIDLQSLFSVLKEIDKNNTDTKKVFFVKKECKLRISEIKEDKKSRQKINSGRADEQLISEKANDWISGNNIPEDLGRKILKYVRRILQSREDVDVVNLLPILPSDIQMSLKEHLCNVPTLRKVPLFQSLEEEICKRIQQCLKPKIYLENKYIIRQGEPLDFILFITQGVAWTFQSGGPVKWLRKGDYYGMELVEWGKLNSTSVSESEFPVSDSSVKCHTKVEAFTLTAIDIKKIFNMGITFRTTNRR